MRLQRDSGGMSLGLMTWLARFLVLVAILVLIGGVGAWLMQRSWFDIKAIELHGELTHVNAASVRASIAGRIRGNFFTAKLEDVRRAFEAVP